MNKLKKLFSRRRAAKSGSSLVKQAFDFNETLDKIKANHDEVDWYPYGTLNNFGHLAALLGGEQLDKLPELAGGKPMVDVGAADGDTVFFMESLGYQADAVDYPPTNFNGCQGFKVLREVRGSNARLHEIDLDAHFELPDQHYGLAFFLGLLYHLKNPYGAMESLSRVADHALVSTRVARYNVATERQGDGDLNKARVDISDIPVTYLVAPDETNNDDTNFWMFSQAGLRRLLQRSGWEIMAWTSVGDTEQSDPATTEHDERVFCLLRSVHADASEPGAQQ